MRRGTLHVLLTASGQEALTLTDEAEELQIDAFAGLEAFATALPDAGQDLDVQGTAAAVQSQIQVEAQQLLQAGVGVSSLTHILADWALPSVIVAILHDPETALHGPEASCQIAFKHVRLIIMRQHQTAAFAHGSHNLSPHVCLPFAGYETVSVLTKKKRLAPLRICLRRVQSITAPAPAAQASALEHATSNSSATASEVFQPDVLLCGVEPFVGELLELQKLSGFKGSMYAPSRNRQCHTFTVLEKRDARSLTLKRVFIR